MKIREIKRRALNNLCRNPFSDKFVFFAFLTRCYLTIFAIYSLVSRQVLISINYNFVIEIIFLAFDFFISILYSYSFDKKLINNSNGDFNFDLKELFYYLRTKGAMIGAIKVFLLQTLLIYAWLMLFLLMAFLISFILGIVLPQTIPALLFAVFMSVISVLVLAIYIILSYSMAVYVKIDNPNMKTRECINESKVLMSGHIMKLVLLGLSFIGWFFVAFFTFGIAYPFVLVYFNASLIEFYKQLKKDSGIYEDDNQNVINSLDEQSEMEETDIIDNQCSKKCKHRLLYLWLTIILSITTFVGMNYIENSEEINNSILNDYNKIFNTNIKPSENYNDMIKEGINEYKKYFKFRFRIY